MADLITLARAITITKSGGTTVYLQSTDDAIDVGGYDSVDLQCSAVSDNASGVTIDILTSMQSKNDDIPSTPAHGPSWHSAMTKAITGSAGAIAYVASTLPQSSTTNPLLRYVRYQITLGASTTQVTFTIEGLARRGFRGG